MTDDYESGDDVKTFRVFGVYVIGLEVEVEAMNDEFAREHAERALLRKAEELGIDPGEAEGHVEVDDVVIA